MKYNHPPAPKYERIITIPVDPTKLIKGHQPRMTGAGGHTDKRFRRTDRREAIKRAVAEF